MMKSRVCSIYGFPYSLLKNSTISFSESIDIFITAERNEKKKQRKRLINLYYYILRKFNVV